jgi:hypothetical protein
MPVVTYVQHLIPSNAIVCDVSVGLLVFARIVLMFLWFPAFAGTTMKWRSGDTPLPVIPGLPRDLRKKATK